MSCHCPLDPLPLLSVLDRVEVQLEFPQCREGPVVRESLSMISFALIVSAQEVVRGPLRGGRVGTRWLRQSFARFIEGRFQVLVQVVRSFAPNWVFSKGRVRFLGWGVHAHQTGCLWLHRRSLTLLGADVWLCLRRLESWSSIHRFLHHVSAIVLGSLDGGLLYGHSRYLLLFDGLVVLSVTQIAPFQRLPVTIRAEIHRVLNA